MSVVHNERIKLTASYLNTGAGACFAAGVVAPVAAVTFGYTGPSAPVAPLTFLFGVTTFFAASLALHLSARYILRSLRP